MLGFLKKLFSSSEEKEELTSSKLFKDEVNDNFKACFTCDNYFSKVNPCDDEHKCSAYDEEMFQTFDPEKPTIILIDDHAGVISFLLDDLKDLNITTDFFNILTFSSEHAAFKLRTYLKKHHENLRVTHAIIDITLGGSLYQESGNVILDGVDVLIDIRKYYKNLEFIFFTGNKLNPYIKRNECIINKFKDEMNDDIMNYVLFKTSLSPVQRKEFIEEFFSEY